MIIVMKQGTTPNDIQPIKNQLEQADLYERGIRTYESSTRNTLDMSAIPVIKSKSHLPIIVDPSHAAGKLMKELSSIIVASVRTLSCI